MVGSGNEVSQLLHRSAARRTVAVTFSDDEESIAFEGTFRKLIELFSRIARQMQKGLMEEMVGALLPKNVLSKAAVVQTRMMADTKSKILQSGDSLPAGEIAELARYGEKNPGAQANRWKKDGAIFAIRRKGADYFPLYALNPDEKCHPYKSIAEILRIFGNSKTGWGTAFWFAGLNSFLDARRPQDLLAGDPALVLGGGVRILSKRLFFVIRDIEFRAALISLSNLS